MLSSTPYWLPCSVWAALLLAGAMPGSAADAFPQAGLSSLPAACIYISVPDQKLALVKHGVPSLYPISTSKFGVGDADGSYKTPLGRLRVFQKLGDRLPLGAVLKGRCPTGEVLRPNAPGRDPIVTRILWLEGLDPGNQRARERGIYIHGTPEESRLGQPVSWGCIRMRSRDVVTLFDCCPPGAEVTVANVPINVLLQAAVPTFLPITPEQPFLPLPLELTARSASPRLFWFRLELESVIAPPVRDASDFRYTALLRGCETPRAALAPEARSGSGLWSCDEPGVAGGDVPSRIALER